MANTKLLRLWIRDPVPDDAHSINQYWDENTEADLARMGEFGRPDPKANIDFLNEYCERRLPPEISEEELVIWVCNDRSIGYSSLKDIRFGIDAMIHLHLWARELWGKGLGSVLFCLSARSYIHRFQLKNLYCQPQADNPFPNGMLKRLGFEDLGPILWNDLRHNRVVKQNRFRISPEVIQTFLEKKKQTFDLTHPSNNP